MTNLKYVLLSVSFLLSIHMVQAQGSCATAVPLTFGSPICDDTANGADFIDDDACIIGAYDNGDDYVFSYTPVTSEVLDLSLVDGIPDDGAWKGLMVTVGCPDDPASTCVDYDQTTGGDASLTVVLSGGTTYYITVSNWPSPQSYAFCLTATATVVAAPSNDDCSSAISILEENSENCISPVSGTLQFATSSGLPASSCGSTAEANDDVWYSFVANTESPIIEADGGSDVILELWDGCFGSVIACADDWTSIAEEIMTTNLTIGSTYYIRVYSDGTTALTGTDADISVCVYSGCFQAPICTGPNASADDCSMAPVIDFTTSYTGSTNCCYDDVEDGQLCGAFSIDNNSWVQFVAAESDVDIDYSVTNCQFGDGIQIGIFDGTCGAFNNSYTCQNSVTGSGQFSLTGLTPGDTYYIMIDGWAGDLCDFSLTPGGGVVLCDNDLCTDAISLSCGDDITNGLQCASAIGSDSDCSTGAGSTNSGLWYSFTGNGDVVTLTTDNPNTTFNSRLHVYEGSCNSKACVSTATGNGTSTVSFPSVNGTNYYIYVDGQAGAIGIYNLTVSCVSCSVTASAMATSTTICDGESTDLSATGGGTYAWDNSAGNGSPVTVTPSITTTYTVTVTDASGACTDTDMVTINVNAPTTPMFTNVGPLCETDIAVVLPTTSTNSITGTWSPTSIDPSGGVDVTATFTPDAGQCASTTTMTVVVNAATTPMFTNVGPLCETDIAVSLPTTSTNSITGTWSPTSIDPSGGVDVTATFTPNAGQCASTTTMTVVVNAATTPMFTNVGPLCETDIAVVLPTTSTNSITGTWSPTSIDPSGGVDVTATFTPNAGQCASTTTMTVVVNAATAPMFTNVGPLCENDIAVSLPTTSTNSITGTWSPTSIDPSGGVDVTATFTPDAGQCASTTTMTVVVNAATTPMFTNVGPLCETDIAVSLPTTSTNSITGTWSPTSIDPSGGVDVTATFTPDAGQCASTTTMTVVVNAATAPMFTNVGPLCETDIAVSLPTTSTNSITGTWSPTSIDPSGGVDVTATFTPDAGQCASTTTMTVVVNAATTPMFTNVGPLCENDIAVSLPTTSTNSITGTWSPTSIDPSGGVDVTATFTPDAGQCASTTTMTVVVNAATTPMFTNVGPLCENDIAVSLPTTSTNSITGTWSPTSIDPSGGVDVTATFTPDAGQCASTTTMTVVVNAATTPMFTNVGPLCETDIAVSLPTTSTNSITGTWSPTSIDPSGGVDVTATFTPDAGQCASTTTMTVVVNAATTPMFTNVGPLCETDIAVSLPTTSTNSITGTWSPTSIDPSSGVDVTATFTPDAGQCASTTTMTVVVNAATAPMFTNVGPLCENDIAVSLPTTSTNSITGTWSPTSIDPSGGVDVTATFTPDAGQCASTTTMTVVVNTATTPTFSNPGPLCETDASVTLNTTSIEGITGTWSPTSIDPSGGVDVTATFTPNAGQCASTTTMTVVVNAATTPMFTNVGPLCETDIAVSLPTTSTNSITGTWSPTSIDPSSGVDVTATFTPDAGQCASTTTMTVVVNAATAPMFTNVGPLCENDIAVSLPTTSTNSITGTWSPTSIDPSGGVDVTATFTPDAGQCASTTTMTVVVNTATTPTFSNPGPLCETDASVTLNTTSIEGITGTWSPTSIDPSGGVDVTATFTPDAGQCASTTTMTVVVNAATTPMFTNVGPLCENDIAVSLPTTSTNSITGTWSPTSIDPSGGVDVTATFTPNAGQCASTTTMTVVVNAATTPMFTNVGPLCETDIAVVLPTTSTNSITGTWSPTSIDPSGGVDVTATFTPDAGQCASTTTMTVVVNAATTPMFTNVGPLCETDIAVSLPTTSTNSITGTWSPTSIDPSSGVDVTATFTPDAGQCASTTTMTVVVNTATTPTFSNPGPLCETDASVTLNTTSIEGITGTWSPTSIDPSGGVDVTATFTPDAGQCASTTTMTVVVNAATTPMFTNVGPLCETDIAVSLPTTSTNSITGTWSPTSIDPSGGVDVTATFTPNAGQCASTTTMTVVVNTATTPTFSNPGPLCETDASVTLNTTSIEGITGTWSPTSIDPSGGVDVTATFTPDAGQCASTTTMTVVVNAATAPMFTNVGPLCETDIAVSLPTTSTNSITGTWSPTSIDPSGGVDVTATFTPNAGQCASTTTMTVVVNTATTPTFSNPGPLCETDASVTLNTTSIEGITGTWSPTSIDPSVGVDVTATFTPDAGQCANTTTMTVVVNAATTPMFTNVGPLCENDGSIVLPTTSTNGVTGSWLPAIVDPSSGVNVTATFTPDAGQCASTTTMTVVVNTATTPTFSNPGPLCETDASVTLNTTSIEGITGTWSPTSIDPSGGVDVTATFTPDAGQCANTTTMTVVVNAATTPMFTNVGPLCENDGSIVLPTTSTNGVTGSWLPAIVDPSSGVNVTATFTPNAGQCASTTTMTVVVNTATTPTFSNPGPLCETDASVTLNTTSIEGITGTWSPTSIDPSVGVDVTATFTPDAGQCANTTTMTVVVNAATTPMFTNVGPLCENDGSIVLPTTSTNGVTGSWLPAIVDPSSGVNVTATFTPDAGQCASTTTMTVVVNTATTPTFSNPGPLCETDASVTLNTTSIEGITGTWSPTSIDPSGGVDVTATFTPDAGQCANTTTMTVVVNAATTPMFTNVGPLCENDGSIVLPTTSTNGVTGSWLPAIVDPSSGVNVTATFTPNAGQCASTTTMTIVVNAATTPMFTNVGPLCENDIAVSLPTTSTNSITGTWSPTSIDPSGGVDVTATFTPDAGQCASTTTMTVVVNAATTPMFTNVGPLCENDIAVSLPTTSTNSITGTWSPTSIDPSGGVDVTATFTPDAGQCASTTTMTVVVNTATTPTFSNPGPLCETDASVTLNTTSIEGITGTWSPTSIDPSVGVDVTATFTPDAGQCANTTTMTVVVNAATTPMFTNVGPLCENDGSIVLPTTSTNGVTGSWLPAIVDPSSGVNVTATFTPNAGQCASTTTMTIVVNAATTPMFTNVGPLCENDIAVSLPTTSTNSITGTWSPTSIDPSGGVDVTATFTPDAGQCASTTTMTVVVNAATTPMFTNVGPLCENDIAVSLPTTSTNSITGTWSPTSIDPSGGVDVTATFTPDAGQCASTTTMTVVVNTATTPTFSNPGPLCETDASVTLNTTSIEGITGTWSPTSIDPSVGVDVTATFTPDASQCANTTTMTVVVNAATTPMFTNVGPLCENDASITLPSVSTNGISGTWLPAIADPSIGANINSTFTPDAGQCANSATITIIVNASPTLSVVTGCTGGLNTGTITTTAIPNNGGTLSFTINGIADPDGNDIDLSNGSYTVIATESPSGCTAEEVVSINCDCPTITISGNISFCQGGTETFSQSGGAAGGTWDVLPVSAGTINTAGVFTADPLFSGNATIAYTAAGCVGNLSVMVNTNITPSFSSQGTLCETDPSITLPITSIEGITGTWSPAIIDPSGGVDVTSIFTPDPGQCATTTMITVMVDPAIQPTFTNPGPFCETDPSMTLPSVSNEGVGGTWSPAVIDPSIGSNITATFTPNPTECASAITMTVMVNAALMSDFINPGPLCQTGNIVVLPTTSPNGVTGTWNPVSIDPSSGTNVTATFTPDLGQCAIGQTMTIVVTSGLVPNFTNIGPLCQTDPAVTLSTTSIGGITGVWSPSSIDPSGGVDITATFTPDAGQCANSTNMVVQVNASTIPAFNNPGPLCQTDGVAILPTTSIGGITGTWLPASIDPSAGVNVSATFTPDAGQCAAPSTMIVVVSTAVVPGFANPGPLCQSGSAITLPPTSTNGITGSWIPAVVDPSGGVDVMTVFTPNGGQCATTVNLSVLVNASPTLSVVGDCAGGLNTGTLATTASAGAGGGLTFTINGLSDPDGNETNLANGSYTVIATESPSGCTAEETVSINCDCPSIVISGSLTLCQGETEIYTQVGGNTAGTWSVIPSGAGTISNTGSFSSDPGFAGNATISYTADGCNGTFSINIQQTITPNFNNPGPFCQSNASAVLPTTSIEGITGTWVPMSIDPSGGVDVTATFTPDAGQCAVPITMTVVINPAIVPSFTNPGPLCEESGILILPTASDNGVSGTWVPSSIDPSIGSDITTTFTPNTGQCATTTNMTVLINPSPSILVLADCSGGLNTGTLTTTASPNSGGTLSFTINGNADADGNDINLSNGSYTVVVTETPSGCIAEQTVSISCDCPTITISGANTICQGGAETYTQIGGMSSGTWELIPSTAGTISSTGLFTADPSYSGNATISYTADGCNGTFTVSVSPNITPNFNNVGPLCQTDPGVTLPLTSIEGITGVWSPTSIDPSGGVDITATFTPDVGQCAVQTTMVVSITSSTVPTFTNLGPLCETDGTLVLPTLSTNGISGTWSPSLIDPSLGVDITATFTPNAGQCATSTAMTIMITPAVLPTFVGIGPLCQSGTAVVLPTTSSNGISGVWNPASVDPSSGASIIATFVSDAGQCALGSSMTITVSNPTMQCSPVSGVTFPGATDGVAEIDITGGTPDYMIDWSGPQSGMQTNLSAGITQITNLAAGNYSVTLTDGLGCTSTCGFTINDAGCTITATATPTAVLCFGGNDGSISVDVQGAVGISSFVWDPSTVMGQNPMSLTAGTYSVTVTDAANCSVVASTVIMEPTAVTISCQSTAGVSAIGATDGAGEVTINGGTADYTVSWTGPQTGTLMNQPAGVVTLSNLAAGTYDLTVTDANGCMEMCSFTVNDAGCTITATATPTAVLCFGGNDGSISVDVQGAVGISSFVWDPSTVMGQNPMSLTAGTYSVTVTDAANCSVVASTVIMEPTAVTISCQSTAGVSAIGATDGAGEVTINGGTADYTVSWTGPQTGTLMNQPAGVVTLSNLAAGTYDLTVTDANGCMEMCSFTVNDAGCTITATATPTAVLCFGGNDGSISVDVQGAVGISSFVWDPSTVMGQNPMSLTAGTYSVTVTDAANCSVVASTVIMEPTAVTISCQSTAGVSAIGATDGAGEVTINGGTADYTVSWTGPQTGTLMNQPAGVVTLSNLAAGTYDLTVTDANGCMEMCSFTVNDAGCTITATATPTAVLCFGGNDGSISVDVQGAVGISSFVWDPSTVMGQNPMSLTAGTYSVTVTDAANCSVVASTVIMEPTAVTISCQSTAGVSAIGATDGAGEVTINGGTADYTVSWTGPQTGTLMNQPAGVVTLSNLAAGTYDLTVTDANGCMEMCSFTVNDAGCTITATATPTAVLCFGGNDGSISVDVQGAVGISSFVWDPSTVMGQNPMSLTAGTYSVTVTDAANCSVVASTVIMEPTAVTISCQSTAGVSAIGATDGAGEVTINGGTADYTVSWTGPQTGTLMNQPAGVVTLSNLAAGTYDLTVTDANGCMEMCSFTVNDAGCTITATATPTAVLCFGGNDGSISVDVQGAVGISSFVWDPSTVMGQNPMSLTAGTYSVTVTDAANCSVVASTVIMEPVSALVVGCQEISGVSGPGFADGVGEVSVSGGDSGYDIHWSGPLTDSLINVSPGVLSLSNLAAGIYNLTITDANGCEELCGFTINDPGCTIAVTASSTDVDCNGSNTGSINLMVTGENGLMTYQWNPDSLSGVNPTGLSAGTYLVTVTDAANCFTTTSAVITEPIELMLVCSEVSPASDFGVADGVAEVNITGGTSNYLIDWGASSLANQSAGLTQLQGLVSGTYTVTVTDANGCVVECGFIIENAACQMSISSTVTAESCAGEMDGSIEINVLNGAQPYQFTWNTLISVDSTVMNLSSGLYAVTVEDVQGCQDTLSVLMQAGSMVNPLVTLTPPLCFGESSGSILIESINGGAAPYVFEFDNQIVSDTIFDNLAGGNYPLTITDANGCKYSDLLVLDDATDHTLDLGDDWFIMFGDSITIPTITSIQNPTSITWFPSEGLRCDSCLQPIAQPFLTTIYAMQIEDEFGCVLVDTVGIFVEKSPRVYVPNIFTPNGDGDNDILSIGIGPEVETVRTFLIYDRWGETIFRLDDLRNNDIRVGWDGTFNGKPMNPAVFVYYAIVEYIDGSVEVHRGDITLMR